MEADIYGNVNSTHVTGTKLMNGIADLRGKSPFEKAEIILKNCVHQKYHEYLTNYLKSSKPAHSRHNIEKCFELHTNLLKTGAMLQLDKYLLELAHRYVIFSKITLPEPLIFC